MGQCEYHVQVAGRKQLSSTRSDPAVPSSGLTLRAMAIAAAIEAVLHPALPTCPGHQIW